MKELPLYRCHKEVRAFKIGAIEQAPATQPAQHPGGDWYLIPEAGPIIAVMVGHSTYVAKHKPEVGGYYVQYDDGYQSYSPAKAFEEGYSPVLVPTCSPLQSSDPFE